MVHIIIFKTEMPDRSGLVKVVGVNRHRSQQEAIKATGRALYTDSEVMDNMPKGEGDEAEVYFFNVGRYISDVDLEEEYESRGLKPADPVSVAAVNEADPAFADEKPHGTHWKDAKGNWCYAAFSHWRVKRWVLVNRDSLGWDDHWWFAGVRISSS